MTAEDNKQPLSMELFKRNERLLHASAGSLHALFSEKDFSAGISRVLEIIGEAADVDRIYIFEKHVDHQSGAQLTSQRHEWCRAGITSQANNPALQDLEYLNDFQSWYETLSKGEPVSGLVRNLPEARKKFLEMQEIVSILLVPIVLNQSLWGFIGFDDCRLERTWSETEISFLSTIAASIGHILLHDATNQSLKRFQSALEGASDAIGMADMQGRHFYQNKAFGDLFGYTVQELENAGGPIVVFDNPADHREVFKSILAGGSWNGELKMHARDGRSLTVLLRAHAIKGKDGKPFAVFGIHTDITEHKKAEKALQESETRYRRLVESATDYIYTVDVENGLATNTRHGPNCIGITGYSSDEYQSDPNLWIKMVHPGDREIVIQQAQCLLKGEAIQPIEHRIFHKNGSVRWVRNTPVPHFNPAGKLISYDGLVSDVTERRNAEEKLKEHAYRLEIINRIITAGNRVDNLAMLLKESLKASIEMVSFAGGGIYLVNAENGLAGLACHQGLPDNIVKKDHILRTSAASCRILFIEGQPVFTDDYSLVLSENSEKLNIQSVARIPLVSRDKIIGALLLVNAQKHIFDEKEKELLMAIGRQIGTAIAKMRSETALRESENQYRTITEQSLVGIHIIKDGRMIYVNEGWTKITGFSSSEVAVWGTEEFIKIVHPEDRKMFLEQCRKKQFGSETEIISIYDCRFSAKNGETKWVSIHAPSVEFAGGRAIVGMIIDITDRKKAEAALIAANKELSTANEHLARREHELLKANNEKEILLKEIHHRVKNNLQVINSLINLQIHNVSDQHALNLLKECQNRIKTIAMVHEKMYQLSDLTRVDISSYLLSLMRHLGNMYSAGSSVAINVNAKNIFLPIDQAIPCALLVNELVSNSLKHAFPYPKKGEINIEMHDDTRGNFILSVCDNGIGLPDDTDYRNTPSLGMQLVTTFVQQLHGTIELENRPGTNFKITLPGAGQDFAAAKKPLK